MVSSGVINVRADSWSGSGGCPLAPDGRPATGASCDLVILATSPTAHGPPVGKTIDARRPASGCSNRHTNKQTGRQLVGGAPAAQHCEPTADSSTFLRREDCRLPARARERDAAANAAYAACANAPDDDDAAAQRPLQGVAEFKLPLCSAREALLVLCKNKCVCLNKAPEGMRAPLGWPAAPSWHPHRVPVCECQGETEMNRYFILK